MHYVVVISWSTPTCPKRLHATLSKLMKHSAFPQHYSCSSLSIGLYSQRTMSLVELRLIQWRDTLNFGLSLLRSQLTIDSPKGVILVPCFQKISFHYVLPEFISLRLACQQQPKSNKQKMMFINTLTTTSRTQESFCWPGSWGSTVLPIVEVVTKWYKRVNNNTSYSVWNTFNWMMSLYSICHLHNRYVAWPLNLKDTKLHINRMWHLGN